MKTSERIKKDVKRNERLKPEFLKLLGAMCERAVTVHT